MAKKIKDTRQDMESKTMRVCTNGHRYAKSSSCPTCPVCEAQKKQSTGFMAGLSAPAQRALVAAGILQPEILASYSETDLLKLHGLGKASLPILKKNLQTLGLQLSTHE